MTKETLVTVITPTYNSERFIKETIKCVQEQTYTNWEMVITDDCSTDQTVNLIKEEQKKDDRIKLIQLPENSGAAVARNTSIKHAKGKYIAFLDSDDLWAPNKLEEQIRFMEEHDYAFTFSNYALMDEHGNPLGKVSEAVDSIDYRELMKRPGTIGCLTVILNREKFDDIYMPLIKTRQDFALWLKLLRNGGKAYGLEKTLAYYRKVPGSISSNKLKAAKKNWYVYRKIEKLNFFSAAYYFTHYAFYNIKKIIF